jgi:phage head maturation protease
VTWADFKEKESKGALMKEIGDRVKERMLGTHASLPPAGRDSPPELHTEIEPRGLWVVAKSISLPH